VVTRQFLARFIRRDISQTLEHFSLTQQILPSTFNVTTMSLFIWLGFTCGLVENALIAKRSGLLNFVTCILTTRDCRTRRYRVTATLKTLCRVKRDNSIYRSSCRSFTTSAATSFPPLQTLLGSAAVLHASHQ